VTKDFNLFKLRLDNSVLLQMTFFVKLSRPRDICPATPLKGNQSTVFMSTNTLHSSALPKSETETGIYLSFYTEKSFNPTVYMNIVSQDFLCLYVSTCSLSIIVEFLIKES